MFTLEQEPISMTTRDPMLPDWYRIRCVRRENLDTFTLQLEVCDGMTSFPFAPGQFNMLYVYGVGEIPISISGNPAQTDRIIHTTRAVGTVTRAMWRMKRGDVIGLRGPYGSAWPVSEARGHDVVVIAGGIGVAPLRPVLHHLQSHRADYGNVVLLHGARTPDDLLYTDEIASMSESSRMEVDTTVDRAVTGWHGNVGVVTTLVPGAGFDSQDAIAMVCGPEVMIRFTIKALTDRGMTKDRIYVSMERNMKCAVGFCGHCQYGTRFICKDGPVFRYDEIEGVFNVREF